MVTRMAVDIRDTLGANIKAEMARRGATQEQLAELLGVSQGQVSRRLNGEITFNVVEVDQIATWLRVEITDLVAGRAS